MFSIGKSFTVLYARRCRELLEYLKLNLNNNKRRYKLMIQNLPLSSIQYSAHISIFCIIFQTCWILVHLRIIIVKLWVVSFYPVLFLSYSILEKYCGRYISCLSSDLMTTITKDKAEQIQYTDEEDLMVLSLLKMDTVT